MRRSLLAVLMLLPLFPHRSDAVEGMWQPHELPALANELAAAGFDGDPATFARLDAHPMNAIVSLGGCSASFVSPDGLIATNHHCVVGTIQFHSTAGRNLLRDGFIARTRDEELAGDPNPRVFVTDRIVDVTERVEVAIAAAGDGGEAIFRAAERAITGIVAECEAEGPYRCEVASFHGGASYRLIRQLEIRDVRLVQAPPESIGKYGGDIDNWMWPRHTGDFAFLRAYVGRDGKPAAHDRRNVPYRPASWLRIAGNGVSEGDFVMVVGYPGRTSRWRLADEFDEAATWSMPTGIRENRRLVEIIRHSTEGRPDAALRYASVVAGLENTIKNFEGQLEAFARRGTAAAKRAEEAAFLEWLAGAGRERERADVEALRQLVVESRARRARDWYVGWIAPPNAPVGARFNREGSVLAAALDLYRIAINRERPEAEREPGYQRRDEPRIRARLETFERRFDAKADRALLEHRIARYAALPSAERLPELDAWLGIGGDEPDLGPVRARLDALYRDSRLFDRAERLAWLDRDRAAIEASGDPALRFAVAVLPGLERIEREYREAAGQELRLRPAHLRALIAWRDSQGLPTYADANGTMRVTFGRVGGYRPRDGVAYLPFTTLAGVAAKATGEAPFDAPARQLEAIRAGAGARWRAPTLGDVPVNFLADLDITGGNSGSATLNARGELVGLIFDMTWDSVASNWRFDPAMTRSIHVDARYLGWVLSEIDGADALLKELGLAEPASRQPAVAPASGTTR
jgi:hypothetical protein